MSYVFDANTTPTTGANALFKLKTLLVGSAGWSVVRSGDGIGAFSSSGDIISSSGSGANGLANTGAYFVLQCPSFGGVSRQLLITRGTTNLLWQITYSFSAGFTGGSATVAPTATDGQNVRNHSGTSTLFAGADGTYRWNAVADTVAPFGFVAHGFPSGGGASNHGFGMIPILTPDTGDTDPYIFYANRGVNVAWSSADLQGGFSGWFKKGFVDQRWYDDPGFGTPGIQALVYLHTSAGITAIPSGIVVNPHDGNDDTFPIPAAVQSGSTVTPAGFKGVTLGLIHYNGTAKAAGDSLDDGGTKTRIAISPDLNMPWNGSTPTV